MEEPVRIEKDVRPRNGPNFYEIAKEHQLAWRIILREKAERLGLKIHEYTAADFGQTGAEDF